jgi:hypothetical protein
MRSRCAAVPRPADWKLVNDRPAKVRVQHSPPAPGVIKSGEYFFFAFAANQRMTAFRSEIGDAPLSGLIANMARIQSSSTTEHQYQHALAQFRRHPSPPGHVLDWGLPRQPRLFGPDSRSP